MFLHATDESIARKASTLKAFRWLCTPSWLDYKTQSHYTLPEAA
jgi:hypothetical protein